MVKMVTAKKIEKQFFNASFLIFIGSFLLALLPLLRYFKIGSDYVPGHWPYYILHLSENYLSLLNQGIANPYLFILYMSSFAADSMLFSKILSFVLGILSLIVFYFILKGREEKESVSFILFVLIFSPFFIYVFTFPTHYSLLVLLFLLGLLTLVNSSQFYYLLFPLISFFGLIDSLYFLILVVLYMMFKKNNSRSIIYFSFIWLVLYQIVNLLVFSGLNFGIPIHANYSLLSAIADFGGLFGTGLFVLILAVIGLSYYWRRRRNLSYVFLFLLFVISGLLVFKSHGIIYFNFLLSFLAGKGLYSLYKLRWSFNEIKEFVIFILLCGVVFSGVSFIDRAIDSEPNGAVIESMEWLHTYDLNHTQTASSIVLSDPKYGFWINQISSLTPVCDETLECNISLLNNIFNSRNMSFTSEYLINNKVKYIYITEDMRNDLIREDNEDGLLFLLINNETFINIYSTSKIQIYETNLN